MGLRFPDQYYGECFFVTTTFKDCIPFGEVSGFYEEITKSLKFCTSKYHAKVIGYVFMPDHIHLILLINGNKLSDFMRDFKKYISQKSAQDLGIKQNHIWMPRYDRVVLTSEEVVKTKLRYIHENPVRAGFAKDAQDWKWSSAVDYFTDSSGVLGVWKGWC